MKPTLLTSYEQVQEGDLSYVSSISAPRNTPVWRVIPSESTDSYLQLDNTYGSSYRVDIENALILRPTQDGGLEILAGKNVFNALTQQKSPQPAQKP